MNESRPPADSLAKAEAWLWEVANHVERVWDQEALVYFISRKRNCSHQIDALFRDMKVALRPRTERKRDAKANDGEAQISPPPDDYWYGKPLDDYSLAPTWFREVQWCEDVPASSHFALPGLAEALEKNSDLRDGNPRPAWLFNMVRSDYAIQSMSPFLERYLEGISVRRPKQHPPWKLPPSTDRSGGIEQHIAHASAIVFAHHGLPSAHVDAKVVQQAVRTIHKLQNRRIWRILTSDGRGSIESTAMAVHALALEKPEGWQLIATKARDWLWSVQGEDGAWREAGTAGPAYLTVLVLDAIALANGETMLTFRWASGQPDESAQQSEVAAVPQPNSPQIDLSTAAGRRAAVDAYIQEVLDKTGIRISRTDIWKKAGYRSRTEFERWQRNDPRATKTAHDRFTHVLTAKPHLTVNPHLQ